MAAAAVWPTVLGSDFLHLQTTLIFAHVGDLGAPIPLIIAFFVATA